MQHENPATPVQYPEYSEALVGFVRALDSAEMAVRTARWHFGDLEAYTPECLANPEDVPAWARHNIENFSHHLSALRAEFRRMIERETQGFQIEANALGDARPPAIVEAAFESVIGNYIKHRVGTISTLHVLPESLVEQTNGSRVVYWDGEVYVIPDEFPNSFVEVWFRRAFGYWEDGGAYPLRLEKRQYGWQAFGFER